MANYCGRFIPNLATLSEPLRQLTKNSQQWEWTKKTQEAFQDVKSALLAEETMVYFDPRRKTELIVDASPVGLGAVLLQDKNKGTWCPVAYASRALTNTETRYAQIEREALAIRWACKHFHLYLCGQAFTVVTDHKPLVPLFTGTARNGPPRIERWAVQLQPYSFEVVYRPGTNNPADYLSRHPAAEAGKMSEEEIDAGAEDFIKMVSAQACPVALTAREIGEATALDPSLQRVQEALPMRKWTRFLEGVKGLTAVEQATRNQIWRVKDELSASGDGLVLRGRKIVLPYSLWDRAVELAHQGHQGMAKTKARLRSKIWFAGMDKMVEDKIRQCHSCLITGEAAVTAPVITEPGCEKPWTCLSMDFGSFPDGRLTAVLIDDFTKFPVVELVESTAFSHVKRVLDKVFALMGTPVEIRTDNGPPFQGHEFQSYLRTLNIKHRRTTPLWPQANGEVERFMRTINRTMRIAVDTGEDQEQALQQFLKAYRQTPHSTTGCAPSDALLRRDLRDVIPAGPKWKPARIDKAGCQEKRRITNEKASHTRRAAVPSLVVGEQVVVKDRHPGWKFRTRFEQEPWTVTRVKGTMVTATRHNQSVTRNVSWFKKSPRIVNNDLGCESPEEEQSATESIQAKDRALSSENVTPGLKDCLGTPGGESSPGVSGGPRNRGDGEGAGRTRSQRYDLRPQPLPNQRLKDYV